MGEFCPAPQGYITLKTNLGRYGAALKALYIEIVGTVANARPLGKTDVQTRLFPATLEAVSFPF